jgi:hypothetical protein
VVVVFDSMFYHPSRGRNIKIGEVDAAIAGASVDENNIVSLNIIIVKVIGSYTFLPEASMIIASPTNLSRGTMSILLPSCRKCHGEST